ncbi:MAG: domain S-box [Myxococcales bacterium]|nr:domain S-box [Myxococcales bacterium]
MFEPPPAFLTAIVRKRSRVLAPAVLTGLTVHAVAASSFGIWPGDVTYAVTWGVIAVLAILTAAIVRQRIPVRFAHLAAIAVLWCPMFATALTLYTTRNQVFAVFFIVQVASAGILLHTRLVLSTLAIGSVLATALLLRSGQPYSGVFASTIVVAALFATMIHFLMLRALVEAEGHRVAEAQTNKQLARRLTELEQSQVARATLQEQLLHAQRMEAVGTLAAGIAHDMNNVLASVTSFASLLRDDIGESEDVNQILQQAERGAALTRGLLAFSRRGQYRKQVVHVERVVRDVLPLLARTLPKSIEIRAELVLGDVCIEADPVHIHQVLVNFGLNAADAMDGKGTIVITGDVITLDGSSFSLPAGRYIRLRVTDTGRGMDSATRSRVFEPFFTTKLLGHGTGLGLSTVWGVVQAHGGAVDVESAVGEGTTFRAHLPVTDRKPAAQVGPRVSQPILRRSTVLVVDDEAAVRESTRRLLQKIGLDVVTAIHGEDALRVFAEHGDAIKLVVLDMGMPVMGGAECFRHIRERSAVPVLIATGYAVDAEAQALVAAGATILEKPFPSADLQREVARLMHRPS